MNSDSKEQVLLDSLEPVYFPSELNIVEKLFLPVASFSTSFTCISGYFSSTVLAELAEPLAYLFQNPSSSGKFIVSPNLSVEDQTALINAYDNDDSIFEFLFDDEVITKDHLVSSTLEVMKYLISERRLDIRIVLMKKGMLHAKVWIFQMPFGDVAIHGSGNATKSGLISNFEQLVFTREWESDSGKKIVQSYAARFEQFWDGIRNDSFTLKFNDKTISDLYSREQNVVSEEQFQKHLKQLVKKMESENTLEKLQVPDWLKYRDGDYLHQGEAVDAWLENEMKGTLEIATGGGKTLTSLVCSSLALEAEANAILIIAVPNKPLIKQWVEDVDKFGVNSIDTEGMGTKNIVRTIRRTIKEHQFISKHSVFIITHDCLKEESFQDVLKKYPNKIMLIGDEAHNLGSKSFVNNPPNFIDYRLALSATPERQYDPEGSEKLFNYFGPVVYQFTLEDAIGNCLVPFEYIAHKVFLTPEEADDWLEITHKINKLLWSEDIETKKLVEQLQIRRRAISEDAQEKVDAFKREVAKLVDRKHSLAFCTDKSPEQLDRVNEVLREEHFIFHQVTGEETGNKTLMKEVINSYKLGSIEMLTSKRVLDEGFNIPPIKTAYFLASSGTVRTWVQRLGRVLRKCSETNKVKAVVHDFVVFPPESLQEYKSLVSGELKRMQWFMKLAIKNNSLNKAIDISNELVSLKEEI